MPENQFVNPDTGEVIAVKSFEKWEYEPMKGWYRVFEEDGSTIAYVPDIVTARMVSTALAMLPLLEFILNSGGGRRHSV